MPGATPYYSWPYQLLTDPPNGASLGHDGFIAADASLKAEAVSQRLQAGAQTWQNGTSDITLSTSTHTPLIVVAIADPGYAYYLECSASVGINSTAWTWPSGAGTSLPASDVMISLTSVAGTKLGSSQNSAYYTAAGAGFNVVIAACKSASLTGAQTVVLSAQNNIGGTTFTVPYSNFTGKSAWLTVDIQAA